MNIVSAFSTPIWESTVPEFDHHKQDFIESVYEIEKEYQNPDQKYYINGYQSPRNVLTHQKSFFHLFEYTIQTALKATMDLSFVPCNCFISSSWVNISKSNSSVLFNTTQRDTFTGIFFLKQPPDSGKFFISNSSINPIWQGNLLVETKNKYNSEKLHVQPTDGQLFLFPSHLTYGLEPNNHNDESICIVMSVIAIPEDACGEINNDNA